MYYPYFIAYICIGLTIILWAFGYLFLGGPAA